MFCGLRSLPSSIGFQVDRLLQEKLRCSQCRALWTPGSGYRPRRDNPHRRPTLVLQDSGDARVRRGHPWIFARDVRNPQDVASQSPCLVNIQSIDGDVLGVALYNQLGAIAARLLSTQAYLPIDAAFFADKLRKCLAYREAFFQEPFYRLAHGEADGLPGLVIDRFGDHVCVQATAAGLDTLLWPIADALEEVLRPSVIVVRQDAPGRRQERAASKREVFKGQYHGTTELRENGVSFTVDMLHGQKTGWYFDQRDNRAMLASFAPRSPRVLDLFSYVGGFGVSLAYYGSEEVLCVDSSESALELCRKAADANSVSGRVTAIRSDVLTFLQNLQDHGPVGDLDGLSRVFDLVIVDPPNLGSERGGCPKALRHYEKLLCAAAGACASSGLLFVASCTHHIGESSLRDAASRALQWAGRTARIVAVGGQSADHPGLLSVPETRYLSSIVLRLD